MWDGEESILCHVCLLMMKDDESALTWTVCVIIWVVWYLVLKSLSPLFCGCKSSFLNLHFFKFRIYRQVHLVFSESAVSAQQKASIIVCVVKQHWNTESGWCVWTLCRRTDCVSLTKEMQISLPAPFLSMCMFFIVHETGNWKNMNNRK